jgi:hypothetical protein
MHIPNLKHDNIGYDTTEGIQVGYTTVNKKFLAHKPGAVSVVDHKITTRRVVAELGEARRDSVVVLRTTSFSSSPHE